MGDALQDTIRRAIETYGAQRVARTLGLSVEATCRLGGGLATQRGTRALAEANLDRLEALTVTTGQRGYVVRG